MRKKYLEGTKIEDLTGMKFGNLTAIDFDGDRFEKDKIRQGNGEIKYIHYHWICKCECGKITSVNRSSLKGLKQSTCGLCYTFEDWCLDNNHQDYLDLWDYDLNDCSPSDIGFGVVKKFYFKCRRGIHNSELWIINNLTSKKSNGNANNTISCRRCNSFGQYLLDTYGNLDMWSDKNIIDPFEVSKMAHKKCYMKCSICGEIRCINLDNFVQQGISCKKCSDGFSIPAKMFKAIIDQLGVKYKMEVTKLDFDWIGNYRYDFYIPCLNLIVEIHGEQHYSHGFDNVGGRTLKEEQYNDKLKKELVIKNGFNYCAIDCRHSELEWLKENIIKEFGKYVDLDNIGWIKAFEYTQGTIVKEVCDYWNTKESNETIANLINVFNISRQTIRTYLNRGTDIGWCRYDANEESAKTISNNSKNNSKRVEMLKDNISIKIFKSAAELERQSERLFNVKLSNEGVSKVCNGKRKQYKGYTFRYV